MKKLIRTTRIVVHFISLCVLFSPLVYVTPVNAALLPTTGQHKVAVILVNFSNLSTASPSPAQAKEEMDGEINNFFKENSYNKLSLSSDVYGWYTMPIPATCDNGTVTNQALATADPYINYNNYQHVVVVFPGNTCGAASAGENGETHSTGDGNITLHLISTPNNHFDARSVAHELGHDYNLHHSNGWECGALSIGDDCTSREYADHFNIMGSIGAYHVNAYQKLQEGWLPTTNVTTVTTSGRYTISPIEISTNLPQVIKIQKNSTQWYYIENRSKYGFDQSLPDNAVDGALIYLITPEQVSGGFTHIIDGNPHVNTDNQAVFDDFFDAGWQYGKTFDDPINKIKVTPVKKDGTVLSVDVELYGQASLPGDLDGDGNVDTDDFTKIRADFGNPYTLFDYNILIGNFGTIQPTPTSTPITAADTPITRKVMIIDFNPIIESRGARRLRDVQGWNDPVSLENQYVSDIRTASGGYLNYQIVTRLANIDGYPTKNNGYVFTDDAYLAALGNPDANARAIIDYPRLLNDYDVCGKVNSGEIDELWLWGGPWFGYWEANMAGTGAYFTNSSPTTDTSCTKKLHIMGFSYERDVSFMIEDLGHRTEGTMNRVFGENPTIPGGPYLTPWGQFATSDHITVGHAGCGWMHYAPNSNSDYDWSNTRFVASTCDDWLNYPNLTGVTKSINCSTWSCNEYDGYTYKKWWFMHLPHTSGQTNGKWNNWWRYITDSD